MEEIINDYEYPSLLADIKKTNYGDKELIDLWNAIDDESSTYMERSDYDIARAIVYLTNKIKKLKEDFEIVDHECSRLETEDIRKDLKINALQKELDKYKEMYAVSIADRVNSAFKQEHKNNEDLEMLYKGYQIEIDTDYIPKSKIKEKIEELKGYRDLAKEQIEEKVIIADSDSLNYGRAEAHNKDIQVLQELMEV